jgi:hypothetical protein
VLHSGGSVRSPATSRHQTMPGILSLPPELLYEIIETVSCALYINHSSLYFFQCSETDRCGLRATCKVLNENADPIVFRCLSLYLDNESPDITEHQIIALATRSSKACELTRDVEIVQLPDFLPASKQSWPHFGPCDDLRVHLPTAISRLGNMTSFRFVSHLVPLL